MVSALRLAKHLATPIDRFCVQPEANILLDAGNVCRRSRTASSGLHGPDTDQTYVCGSAGPREVSCRRLDWQDLCRIICRNVPYHALTQLLHYHRDLGSQLDVSRVGYDFDRIRSGCLLSPSVIVCSISSASELGKGKRGEHDEHAQDLTSSATLLRCSREGNCQNKRSQ